MRLNSVQNHEYIFRIWVVAIRVDEEFLLLNIPISLSRQKEEGEWKDRCLRL